MHPSRLSVFTLGLLVPLSAHADTVAPAVPPAAAVLPGTVAPAPGPALGAQCSTKVQGLLKLLGYISSGNRVGISKTITHEGKDWKCDVDGTSPNMTLKGSCDESTITMMSNGGVTHLHRHSKNVLGALNAFRNNDPADAVKPAATDVWYDWAHKTEGTSHHFTGRFCAQTKDDYPVAKAWLKNSAAVPVRGEDPLGAAVRADLSKRNAGPKVQELYSSNKTSNSIAILATVEEGKCDDITVGFVTALTVPRENNDRHGKANGNEYHGGKPFGGSAVIHTTVKYNADKSDDHSAVFYGDWRRSLLTGSYNDAIARILLGWLKNTIGARPNVPGQEINLKNWDVQRRAVIRMEWDDSMKTYTWRGTRQYRVMRLKKNAGISEVTKNIPVGEWYDLGGYKHADFKLHVYDRDDTEFSDDKVENDRIKGQIARVANLREGDKDKKCPEAIETVDATIKSLKRYDYETNVLKRDPMASPGDRFGKAPH